MESGTDVRCCGWFGKGVPGGKTGPVRFACGLPCGSHWSGNYEVNTDDLRYGDSFFHGRRYILVLGKEHRLQEIHSTSFNFFFNQKTAKY